jgi:hypothetical protein
MVTNELTLLTVVVLFKNVQTFYPRFMISLEQLLHAIEIPKPFIDEELREMHTVQFARNTNRSTLGSMNDFVFQARAAIYQDHGLTLDQLNLELNEIPCSPLKYSHPSEAVRELFHRSAPAN